MQPINLTAAHWIYLAGILVIIATMVMRKNIVVPAVIATFLTIGGVGTVIGTWLHTQPVDD